MTHATINTAIQHAQLANAAKRILHATKPVFGADDIKELIKSTTLKTAEFVAAILADAAKENVKQPTDGDEIVDGTLQDANGKVLKYKSVKSPKQLVEFWQKHGLPMGALKRSAHRVHIEAPRKAEKVKASKPAKTTKPKAEKPAKSTTGKRGRPRKQPATILQIADFRQGDLNLEVVAA